MRVLCKIKDGPPDLGGVLIEERRSKRFDELSNDSKDTCNDHGGGDQ